MPVVSGRTRRRRAARLWPLNEKMPQYLQLSGINLVPNCCIEASFTHSYYFKGEQYAWWATSNSVRDFPQSAGRQPSFLVHRHAAAWGELVKTNYGRPEYQAVNDTRLAAAGDDSCRVAALKCAGLPPRAGKASPHAGAPTPRSRPGWVLLTSGPCRSGNPGGTMVSQSPSRRVAGPSTSGPFFFEVSAAAVLAGFCDAQQLVTLEHRHGEARARRSTPRGLPAGDLPGARSPIHGHNRRER